VRFDSNVHPGLDWQFRPVQTSIKVHPGEQQLAFFEATNLSDEPILGRATFNVVPHKAGPFFVKIDCFCFTEQRLAPGQTVSMPVTFYVDPEMYNDVNTADVETITLSYTFFRARDDGKALPVEAAGKIGDRAAITIGGARLRPNG
jgi:cytochrome c oxidase assembly protein subunit 11